MRILLLGKNGQLGWELQRSLAPLGELIALDRRGRDGACGDLANLDGLRDTVRRLRPDVIVNAAAYTAVDRAESEPELAYRINADAPGLLAWEAAALGAWLVHYSTDYVFDGSGSAAWTEDASTAPLSVYGASKHQGETAITAAGAQALIFRTSWVYAARGNNFAKTMLRLAAERDALDIVGDQIGAPTGADLIADVTALALRQLQATAEAGSLAGIYHLAANGACSWYEYARFVIDCAREAGRPVKVAPAAIRPIPTSDYPTPARRPLNSRLDTRKLRTTFDLHLPAWQQGVARMLAEISE